MLGSHYTAVRTAFPDLEIRLRRKRVRHRYMQFLFLARYSAPSSPLKPLTTGLARSLDH
jgi:hypothetical protein